MIPPYPSHLPSLRTARALARAVPPSFLVGLGLVLGVVALGAQEGSGAAARMAADTVRSAWEPPAETVRAVGEALARRWSVLPESLVLEWGAPRGGTLPEGLSQVELLGSGRDGHWVASLRSPDGPARAYTLLLRAGVTARHPVARRSLERGQPLGAEDVDWVGVTRWGFPEEPEESPQAGWIAQRRIDAGELLRPPAVRPPHLVVSGRPVKAVWTAGRVEVALQGRAVSSGSLGERVFLRTDGGRRLEGVVAGPGLVRLSSPTTEVER